MTKFQKIGFSAFAIKMIMVVLMLGDHLVMFLPEHFPFELRYAGRLVLPTFTYLMTVSLVYTRDRLRFFLRLAIAGFIMLAVNMLLVWTLGGPEITNNIFLALAVSAGLIISIERIIDGEGNAILNAVAAALLFYAGTFVEGGLYTPIIALVFYFLRGHKLAMCIVFIAVAWIYVDMLRILPWQHYQALAIIPIMLFNGQKGGGSGGFDKWFFYIFYALHVWWLFVIRALI